MNAIDSPPQDDAYCCPGQQHPISRAVHLGRLAAFYPTCRDCPHRDQTGTLSPRQVEQLEQVRSSTRPRSLFHDEGAAGAYLNELTPATVRQMAAAFGLVIVRGEGRGTRGEGKAEGVASGQWLVASANQQSTINNQQSSHPSILLATDGRAITAELTAAAAEGVRTSGCELVDIGPATAACLAFGVHHLQAAGGILVGNPGRQPHLVGLQFWAAGPRPLSAGGPLEPIVERYQAGVDRPTRTCGQWHRFQADLPYLAVIQEYYHALRPLRVVVDSASRPLLEYLQRLAATVACEVIACRVAPTELAEQVRANAAHLAVCVDGDGETCHVLDERGRAVPIERLLLLLVQESLSALSATKPRPVVVLEESTPAAVVRRIEELGARVVLSKARRAEMAAAMNRPDAVLGGGPSGRFWHREATLPLPDVLMTVTRLLTLLSRSDEPFSAVLDRDVPIG
jgi:phosphomannomutase